MPSLFPNSVFYDLVLQSRQPAITPSTLMGGMSGSFFPDGTPLSGVPVVVFDFETTGLDTRNARIIEIGAIKYKGRREVDRMSTLVDPGVTLPPEVESLCGISQDMLVGKPRLPEVLPAFHDFLRGCLGVAHNAEFDCGMLAYESARLAITCQYMVVCTLKMSRELMDVERRNLDALAEHLGLGFESRHRSIGDILVTAGVLWHMLDSHPRLSTVGHLAPFRQEFPTL